MELSRELFKQIIAQLKGCSAGGQDKRKSPRVGLRNRVTLSPLKAASGKAAASCEVAVRDLSPDGIGILHTARLGTQTHFAIRLPAGEGRDMLAIYVVKHCDSIDENLYRIGGALVKICDPNPDPPPAAPKKAEAPPAAKAPADEAITDEAITPAEKDPKVPQPAAAN